MFRLGPYGSQTTAADQHIAPIIVRLAGGCGLNIVGANRLILLDPRFASHPVHLACAAAQLRSLLVHSDCFWLLSQHHSRLTSLLLLLMHRSMTLRPNCLSPGSWNPADDLQAMGRVWREGQKKDVSMGATVRHERTTQLAQPAFLRACRTCSGGKASSTCMSLCCRCRTGQRCWFECMGCCPRNACPSKCRSSSTAF